MGCGSSLGHASAVGARASTPMEEADAGERRFLTVMFCDLVSSTALAERLDPEDLRDVLSVYRNACAVAVLRYEGHIHQYLGDGLLAFFGYPRAHEDDPCRAIQAGFAILEAIVQCKRQIGEGYGAELAVRIGIHTGLAVAGDIVAGESRQEQAIVGETPNIAARLQAVARPNQMVVSEEVRKLVEGYFEFEPLGHKPIKGLSREVTIYAVKCTTGARSRLEASEGRLLPLVGRRQELAALDDFWHRACTGHGVGVLLRGEAGIGKSRLAKALTSQIRQSQTGLVLEMQCRPYYQNTPLYPGVECIDRLVLHFSEGMSTRNKLRRVEAFLRRFDVPLCQSVPLLASLLSIPVHEPYRLPDMSPERLRVSRLDLLVTLLCEVAADQPVLLLVEDLHWVDPTTLQWLQLTLEAIADRPVLLLLTARPEFEPEPNLPLERYLLERLPQRDLALLSRACSEPRRLPEEVIQRIVDKADGVPLFAEELTKAVVATLVSGIAEDHPARSLMACEANIPDSLQASLVARLDRLAHAKETAQIGAVLGREFSERMMLGVAQTQAEVLQRDLQSLVDAEILFRRDEGAETVYTFKHALIQGAAYQTLLKRTRRRLHKRVADVILRSFPELAQCQPELVAQHYSAAGESEKAVGYWLLAGQLALKQSDNLEAIAHLRKGLQSLDELPQGEHRRTLELALLSTLGLAIIATQGFAAQEVGEVYTRAGVLRGQLGASPAIASALWGLWVFHLVRARLDKAEAYARELLGIGELFEESSILIEGHWTLGDTLFWKGELESAHVHLVEAVRLYDPALHARNAFVYGQDPGVSAQCYLAYVAWHLGRPRQAREHVQRAMALAEQLGHAFSIGWSLGFNALLSSWDNDVEAALEAADRAIEFCSEQLQPFWLYAAMQNKGWALVKLGRGEEGLNLLEAGLAGYCGIGSVVVQPHFYAFYGDALHRLGRHQDALAAIEQGLRITEEHQERVAVGELWRQKGVLLQSMASEDAGMMHAAKECHLKAIAHAQEHGALMREVLARMSFGSWLASEHREDEACAGLRDVLARVSADEASPWLQEARRLLGEWSMVAGMVEPP